MGRRKSFVLDTNVLLHDPLAGRVTLVKGERSPLAERAANLL